MKRTRMIAGFWVRLVCFLLILAGVLAAAAYILIPKAIYGLCPIVNLYAQEENTVDVLVMGTSLAYAGVNTNVLWEEFGIAAYNLCGAEQPYWITYHWLQEALKTQKPKLIILDAKAATYLDDYSKRGRTILATYGIRDWKTRLSAIRACVEEKEFLSFVLAFPQLHSNYADLTKEHFQYPLNNGGRGPNWKGYIETEAVEVHEEPQLIWNQEKKPMNPREVEYLQKTMNLIREAGIPCLLVAFPNPDYAYDHFYYNSLWELAKPYRARIVNYNDPTLRLRMDYERDFADWQHMNVRGSVKFTRRLGEDLMKWYRLPDRRGDAQFISYELCAQDWYEKYPKYHPEMED